jgi:hypothetical protein
LHAHARGGNERPAFKPPLRGSAMRKSLIQQGLQRAQRCDPADRETKMNAMFIMHRNMKFR